MKDNVNDEVPNGIPKIWIPFDWVVNWGGNWDGVLKSSSKPKDDHATHLWSWIKWPIPQSSIWKCSYAYDILEGGPMIWISSTMHENR